MDAVKAFNNELASLYESKPPVSRAKMAGITKSAIKAVKFYKHVVQSVEKFILKCRAEYKVPGLYVIDSIVRQSRHHFGAEKDVFAQRFSKNIVSTFQNLCSCPPEERSKIVRVLHLWQKNSVFSSDVIQQLLKMVEQEESISPAAELFDESQTSQRSGASDEIVGTELLSTSDEQRNSRPTVEVKSTVASVVDHFGPSEDKVSGGSRCSVEGDPGAGLDVQTNVLSSVIQLLQSQQPSSQLLQQQILQQLPQQLLQSGSLSLPQQLLQQLSSASEPHQQQQQHPTPASLSFAAAPFSSVVPSSVPLPPEPSPLSHQINAQQRQPEQPSILLSEPQSSIAHLYDRRSEENSQGSEPRFNKSLLEFDYGESDEDDNRQIRPRTEEIIRPPTPTEDDPQGHPNHQFHAMDPSAFFMTRKMEAMSPGHHLQHQQQQQHLNQQPPLPLLHPLGPLVPDRPLLPPGDTVERHDYFRHGSREVDWQNEDDNDNYGRSFHGGFDARQSSSGWRELDTSTYENADHMGKQRHQQDYEDNWSRDRSRHRDHEDRKRRRSRDRSPRQQHGHSRGDRESSRRSRSRDRRRKSRSRDRGRRSRSRSQDRIREREKRERERERRNRGLPPIEDQHISVCSTTLWIGHLSKHTKENELKEELSKYGEITSFNLIPPRGCSYVSFGSRREATRALEKLRGSKLLGNVLKVAWAMGVGMKESEFKDSWDVGQGVSYIPWDRIPEDLDSLADGGFLDEDTLPETVKIVRREKLKEMERQSTVISDPESLTRGSTNVIQVSADTPTAPPPPLPALPPGIIPPLLPPPPGFVPSMMVPGTVPAMMRLPPPMMHGPMPPGMAAPPPPSSRPALPATTSALESVSAGESSSMALGHHHGMASEGVPPIPPPDPPGMGFGWQVHSNMRPGMVPFRPQLPPPFIPPGPFGHRMPFPSPLPPHFQGSGDPKTEMENPEDEPMEPADGEKAEDKEERLESSIPLPPGGPPPQLPSWHSMRVSRPPNGPPPEFMGGRPRAPFGPRAGFPAPLLPLPGGRLSRSEEEEMEDGIGGRDDEMNEDNDMDEPAFPGPEGGRGFHPRSLVGPMRGGRPPWFDFRDGPQGPPGPRGMRIPGPPPRFPFDERGMGIGRPPPFRIRGPPSVMGDDQRFGVPSSMGMRGRPPFPPRRLGMQNFGGRPPMDQPPFGQPRFGDRGPQPLFPRGFGRPSANDEMESYGESLEDNETDVKKDWNKGKKEEEEDEDRWQGKAGDHLGEMGSHRQQQRGGGERGRWEGAERNWSRGSRREDDRERGRWTDRGRRGADEEEGGERRQRSHHRRDEDTMSWAERDREQQRGDRGGGCGVETTASRERPGSAWGEAFDARDETAGVQEAKVNSAPVPAKSEKRPRKTRWSSAVVDPVETNETQSGSASDTVSGPVAAEVDSAAAAGAHLDSFAVGEQ